MKSTLLLVTLALPLILGCQKFEMDPQSGGSVESVGTTTVRAANGTLYAISCLRDHAEEIHAKGQEALAQCKINPTTGEGRQFHNGRYYFIFWPPTYYSASYKVSYYPSSTTYYYPPATTQPTSSNPFCSYVFGGSTSLNCYYLFGYTNTYTSYYTPSCSNACMYAYNPSKCQNKCWSSYSWNQ